MCVVGYFEQCICGHYDHQDHILLTNAGRPPYTMYCKKCSCTWDANSAANWPKVTIHHWNDPAVPSVDGFLRDAMKRLEDEGYVKII